MTSNVQDLKTIIGADNILEGKKSLEAYSHDHSFAHPMKPWFVVKPKNVDEVQGIIKWANDTKTPLVP